MRTPDVPASGRRGAVAVAVVGVAAVVVGIAALTLPRDDSSQPPPAAAPGGSSGSTIEVDLGPADPAALRGCAGEGFVADPAQAEVLYGVLQRGQDEDTSVLVVRNPAGDVRVCDAAETGSPAVEPLPTASADRPVVFLTNGGATWDCDGEALDGYRSATWLLVHDSVARVEQRFVVDGTPGPWFSTAATGGIAHLPSWLGPQPAGVAIVSEQRALDAEGVVVPQETWPSSERLVGCPEGASDGEGDAQIL